MEATETRRPLVFSLGISMVSITFLFVFTRFYCRTVLIKALGFDDLFILLATFALISYTALLFFGTSRFLGHHIWDRVFMAQMEENSQSNLVVLSICAFLTIIVMTCTIVSTLLTYLRLFEDRLNRWFCYSVMIFTVSFSVFSIVIFSIMISRGKFFVIDPTGKIDPTAEIVTYTFLAIVGALQFLVTLWPLQYLIRVRIPSRHRTVLLATFSVGISVCVMIGAVTWSTFSLKMSNDRPWDLALATALNQAQLSLGVICPCVPVCRPIYAKMFPTFFANTPRRTSRNRRNMCDVPSRLPKDMVAFQMPRHALISDTHHLRYEPLQGSNGTVNGIPGEALRSPVGHIVTAVDVERIISIPATNGMITREHQAWYSPGR